MVDAHVSGACAARRAGSIPVLGTITIEDSAGGVIHFTPPVFCLCRFGVAKTWLIVIFRFDSRKVTSQPLFVSQ